MKAIILNSGIGRRMLPFTNDNPKCFARLNGKNILEHEIENLLSFKINNIIITTGPFEGKIKKFVKDRFPDLNVAYVKNPKYYSTNYIYSLWLARGLIDDDVILLHGDMVFEKRLLGKLLNDKRHNCVLVNNKIEPPEKDFKGKIKNNIIKKIGVNLSGKNAFFLPPIYKFSKDSFSLWLDKIGKFIKKGDVNVYAENAFNEISDKIRLHPVYFGGEFCMEIDNFSDLEAAKFFFQQQ